jgi:hypothetical protein
MFWTKKTIESEEFKKLYALYEEQRIKLESLCLDVQLYKKKLKYRAGLNEQKEENTKEDYFKNVLLPE